MKGRRGRAALLVILLCAALLRLHLSTTPLERDEGEYAYAGQLILQGIPPYSLALNMKLPGTYAMHALIMALFGQSIAAIHIGLLLVNAASCILVFLIARRLWGEAAAVAAAAAYAALSISPVVSGSTSHATQYLALFALAGSLCLLRGQAAPAGLSFGLCLLMKQHGLFFVLFGLVWLVYARASWRNIVRFAAAAVAPYAVTCLILWRAGVFSNFWFWTVTYARAYASRVTPAIGWSHFTETFGDILADNPIFWILAAVSGAGLLASALSRRANGRDLATGGVFAAAFFVFAFLTAVPGLLFREHYFIPLMPAVALFAGATAAAPGRWRRAAQLTLAAAVALTFVEHREFFFHMPPDERARELWGENPFPEAIPAAAWLREHTAPTESFAILGSEPEIYFYAHRHSATGYIYMYGLMEPQPYALRMQEELIGDLERARPRYIVDVDVSPSWLMRDNSATRIFDWWNDYRTRYYVPAQTFGDLVIYQRSD